MRKDLFIYNSYSRKKEQFEPLHEGYVGLYVCGPTVYSDVHLGNCRTFASFDVVYRFLKELGYKVRYVRNITDVGHLVGDVDTDGEDKIAKRARLEQLEPMEIVQNYSNGFHDIMRILNVSEPSIEPRATGHIIEQIQMVRDIIENGYGYEVNGSVYFDTLKFEKDHKVYGKLSGRVIDELIAESRDDLKNQDEKRHPSDFAIWIKADERHIMRWPSPWSEGFPGWHLECSAMSTKYLGKQFDIHGGGSDLKFPHHENEIAQNLGACKCSPARIWMHGNMLLMNGKKMSKSDGNSITPEELFSGNSPHISKAYSPMVIRFFMLQSHYRSTLDLTDEALLAAEKGYRRMMEGVKIVNELEAKGSADGSELDAEINQSLEKMYEEMCDDFNTPKTIALVFDLVSKANSLKDGHLSLNALSPETLSKWKAVFHRFIFEVFGLKQESGGEDDQTMEGLMQLVIDIRQRARDEKNWATSDLIRDALKELNIVLKDGKDGTNWSKD